MRKVRLLAAALGVLAGFQAAGLRAADWPQYRGPNQDGISTEKVNLTWAAEGPKVVWKVSTRNGFSSFAIAGGKAFTQVNRDINGQSRELCVAMDAATGKELWSADIDEGKYVQGGDDGTKDNQGGDGPRSTPTVNDGMVYVATQNLVLYCLDAETGKQIWTKNLIKEHAGRNIGWKSAASPVIDGDLLFVGGGGAGQSLLALNKKTGQVIWKAHDEIITHATPTVATIQGQRQVIFFLKSGLLSVSATDGKALWRFPFKFSVSSAINPVVSGDIVYCSAGYGVGGGACKITRNGDQFTATELWKTSGDRLVANHWSTPVCKDGYLYGMFSFKKYGSGPLKCVELATGKVVWEKPGFGAGNVILAGDKIVALTDDGQLVVVEATPTAYKEVARAKVVAGKCWSTPALSNGRLYVRSTKEGACLDVAAQ
ncbi:MAG: PQQ-binding-like beta-propeller repeat protein [Bacillota bacterium]